MKTYKANRVSKKLKKEIEKTISIHEQYKKAYFWTPPRNAAGRRKMEAAFEGCDYDIIKGDDIIQVRTDLSCTCNNIYYYLDIKVNGEKKNITVLKKFLK